jgi:hypothetical protein
LSFIWLFRAIKYTKLFSIAWSKNVVIYFWER